MAEAHKRILALMNGDHGRGKRQRVPVVVDDDDDEVKEEGEFESDGGAGEGAVVAVAAMEEPQISLMFAVSLFHCEACLLPLKPPTFKCEAEHVVCGGCRGKHAVVCSGAESYASCRMLDAIVLDAKLPCDYAEFGCKSVVTYFRAADHHTTCPSAPCFCPAPNCDFVSSPAKLVEHFHGTHQWPVTGISYGRPLKLAVPAPEGWHVLVGDGDRAVFIVSASALGAATAVSLVRVAANGASAAAGPFWCKVWAELPTNKNKMVMITCSVGASDLSRGLPEHDENMFLVVPPALLHDASGEAPELMVFIDKPKAAAVTPKCSTPPSRSSTPPSSSYTPPSRSASRMLQ